MKNKGIDYFKHYNVVVTNFWSMYPLVLGWSYIFRLSVRYYEGHSSTVLLNCCVLVSMSIVVRQQHVYQHYHVTCM